MKTIADSESSLLTLATHNPSVHELIDEDEC